jgi:hypothetical protein
VIRKTLLIVTAAAGLTTAAQAIDDQTFFSGIHLGMTLKQVEAYYHPYHDLGEMWHSGALPDEKDFDLRTSAVPQRRIYFSVRTTDNKVVSVMYWKLGDEEAFTKEEVQQLTSLNRLTTGKLYSTLTVEQGTGAQL